MDVIEAIEVVKATEVLVATVTEAIWAMDARLLMEN